MNKANFTKGEWSIDRYGNQIYLVSSFDENNKAICSVSTYGSKDNSIREANAHLIAAAPTHDKVLCMVEEKLPLTPNAFSGDYMITLTQEEVNQIRETLNKARG